MSQYLVLLIVNLFFLEIRALAQTTAKNSLAEKNYRLSELLRTTDLLLIIINYKSVSTQ